MAWLLLRRALLAATFLYGQLVAEEIVMGAASISWRSAAFLILVLSAALQTWCAPFKLDEDDQLEHITLLMLMLSVYVDMADTSNHNSIASVVVLLSVAVVGGAVGTGDTPIIQAIAKGFATARATMSDKCCCCVEDRTNDLSTDITAGSDNTSSPAGSETEPHPSAVEEYKEHNMSAPRGVAAKEAYHDVGEPSKETNPMHEAAHGSITAL